ncbi:MAG: AAA family ATPase [Promethearchaeota archaeon]
MYIFIIDGFLDILIKMIRNPHMSASSNQIIEDEKAYVVAVSGKGGVGKTTISALLIKYLTEHFEDKDILVVDGDPAANIPEVLGIQMDSNKTISKVTSILKKKVEKGELPPGYDKGLALEAEIQRIIYEEDDFDILVLGRGEGEGCYCFINNLLKNILDPLEDSYDIIFMDMEAGLEHLSRRTDKDVDELIIVTDMSRMGLNTLERIVEISLEVHLDFRKYWVIGNQFQEEAKSLLEDFVNKVKLKYKVNIELAGFVPSDNTIVMANLKSEPLYLIAKDTPSYRAIEKIGDKLFKNLK